MKLRHIHTGIIGIFIKSYTPSGRYQTTQTLLKDGRIYFAPTNEF